MKSLTKTKILSGAIALSMGLSVLLPTLNINHFTVANAEIEHRMRNYAELDDTERFMVGGFFGGDASDDEGIELMTNAGMDFTFMYGNNLLKIIGTYLDTGETDTITSVYDKLHDAGLKLMIEGASGTQPAASGVMSSADPFDYSSLVSTGTPYGAWSEQGLGLEYDDVVYGTHMWDEPADSMINYMDDYIDRYEEAFPDKLFFVNLIAREGIIADLNSDGVANVLDYIYYIKHYATNVVDNISGRKMISTDPYPFFRLNLDSPSYYYINKNYITTLATSAIEAKAHGADLSYYVQVMDCSQESHAVKNSRDVKGQADVSMQYNIAMAFGAKQIINFCYETPDSSKWPEPDAFMSDAMVTVDGEPTSRYTWVQNATAAAHSMGEAYMRFDWNGTIISKGTMNDRFNGTNNKVSGTSFDCYSEIDSAIYNSAYYYKSLVPYASEYNSNSAMRSSLSGSNLVNVESSRTSFIGCFTDDAGYKGYMVASGDDAVSNTATALGLTFDNSTEKVRVFNGKANPTNGNKNYYDVDLDDHVLEIGLNAGEGVFIVPFKATEVENVTIKVEGLEDENIKVETGESFTFPNRVSGIDENRVLVGYVHNGGFYPVGYTLNNIDSDTTITAVFVDLTMQHGASVRINWDKEHAIRWKAYLNKSELANLKKKYTVLGYGFTVMSQSRKGALDIPISEEQFREEGDNFTLAGVMTNVSEGDLCEVFEARAYIKIRFSNGAVKKIYAKGNENDRSIAQVAAMALADTTQNWSAEKAERLRLLSSSYTYDDNVGSFDDWEAQANGDNVGSLDYWLRLIAMG